MKKTAKVSIFVLAAISVAALAMGGYDKADTDKGKAKENLYSQVELFADAVSMIRSEYVDEIEPKKLIYGALKGMLSSLDEFSSFLEPDEYNEMKVETKGEFGGIGIEISLKEGIPTIVTPLVGTPAEAAGLKSGDRIVRIDGKITRNATLSDIVKQLRGKPGTSVTLTIWREKDQKIMEVPLRRELIKVRSVKKSELIEDRIGYIRLIEFQDNTAADLDAALKRLESEGMDCLIIDLRNNPGGLLDAAIAVSERFLPKDKVIVSIKSRDPKQNIVFKSSGKIARPDYPLIIMVNEGSASASEIVAGAAQDNKRALVLGTKTYGKASVQTVIALKDGSALRLTTASYLTPNGKLIRNLGIAPDVVVEREEPVEEKDKRKKTEEHTAEIFEKVEESLKIPERELSAKELLERDNQLRAAVNLMKGIKVYKNQK